MSKYCAVSHIADMVTVISVSILDHTARMPSFLPVPHSCSKFTSSETFWSPCWHFCSFLGVPFVPIAVLGPS